MNAVFMFERLLYGYIYIRKQLLFFVISKFYVYQVFRRFCYETDAGDICTYAKDEYMEYLVILAIILYLLTHEDHHDQSDE